MPSKASTRFDIQYMNPKDLIDYPGNTKEHSRQQISRLCKNLGKFGFDVPIVVDEKFVIIKGHCRKLAAISRNMKSVPVIVRDDMSEEEIRAARIADNKLAESPWDYDMLKEEIKWLEEHDIDLNDTGFDMDEIASIYTMEHMELDEIAGPIEETEFEEEIDMCNKCPKCDYEW